ncbi:MAG: sodium:calcium antiporter [Elusimicrobia bacterium]|nr:sodium:calcium antiporter [Elusimicrobiota bacterium]
MAEEPLPRGRYVAHLALAVLVCAPWLFLRLSGGHPPQPWAVLLPGVCIFGAAFLLTWGAEAAEMDIPQSISIGLLALIAVLPEYAVDMVFAWKGGKDPAYIPYATANMTGANRLLIGVGWPAVLLATWWKHGKKEIVLTTDNAVEMTVLLLATSYAFVVPFKGNLSLFDTVIFVGLFGYYAWRSSQAETDEPELEGPAEMIGSLPTWTRRAAVGVLFAFAAGAIGLSAEPFAEGILDAGRHWGIEEFILVQWLAPLASEAPEFIVAIVFALKGKASVALRALVSSKVNQWTLLVGLLPLVYGVSSNQTNPMPLDARQVEEIFLTSAQSLFGLTLIMNLKFSLGEASALLVLFLSQILFHSPQARWAFAGLYIALSVALIATGRERRSHIGELIRYTLKRS